MVRWFVEDASNSRVLRGVNFEKLIMVAGFSQFYFEEPLSRISVQMWFQIWKNLIVYIVDEKSGRGIDRKKQAEVKLGWQGRRIINNK